MSESSDTHNVDDREIRKFEALAARWWDPNSEFRPLHEINPLRLDLHRPQGLASPAKRCSTSVAAAVSSPRPWHTVAPGSPASTWVETPLEVARLHLLESGAEVDYRQITAEASGRGGTGHLRRRDLHGDAGARAHPASVVRPAPIS